MNLSIWSDVCRIATIIGSAMALLGTIGHFILGRILDRQKNERIGQLETGNASLKRELAETTKIASDTTNTLATIRDYSEVAHLNMIGKPQPDGDIIYNTPISSALEGGYELNGTRIRFLETEHSEQIFRDVIKRYPKFPFPYYALAKVLSDRGDLEGKVRARQCLQILEKTTLVPGHHQHHDEMLALLRTLDIN